MSSLSLWIIYTSIVMPAWRAQKEERMKILREQYEHKTKESLKDSGS